MEAISAAVLARQGPDGVSTWSDAAVALGQASLRTTEDEANEPLPLHHGGLVLVGAVRLDGRDELAAWLGVSAARCSDAGLLLRAYRARGRAALAGLSGDFAFALWDAGERKLTCVRDPFGVRPLYYACPPGRLVVSNTIDAILATPGVADELDPAAVGDVLVFGMNYHRERSCFRGLRRVPPGHALEAGARGGVRSAAYFEPPGPAPYRKMKAGELIAGFTQHLEQAVADRLRTPRVGAHLSGGLDTPSIAAILRDRLGRRADGELRAFTTVFETLIAEEEGHYAALVARHLGIETRRMVADRAWDASTIVAPEPIAMPAWTPGYAILSELEGAGVRVLFTGFGGDPALHPGYEVLADYLRRGQPGLFLGSAAAHVARFGQRPRLGIRAAVRARLGRPPAAVIPVWVQPALSREQGLVERFATLRDPRRAQVERRGMLSEAFWSNMFEQADPGWSQRNVEQRFPFFDLRLYEFLRLVPPLPWFVEKTLLRDAMRGRLPEPVLTRRKAPLPASPFEAAGRLWSAPEWMRQNLAEAPSTLDAFVDRRRALQQLMGQRWTEAMPAVTLAHWLNHRRPPRVEGLE